LVQEVCVGPASQSIILCSIMHLQGSPGLMYCSPQFEQSTNSPSSNLEFQRKTLSREAFSRTVLEIADVS
jgi:hypothetical protein